MDFYRLIGSALDIVGERPAELQVIHTSALVGRYYPNVNTDRPALIGPIDDAASARSIHALLCQAYPKGHAVILVSGLQEGIPRAQHLLLEDLVEAVPPSQPTLLYLPPLPCAGSVETFQDTVARLRAPDGCPWDRQQTHRSLRQGFQEEAYEVLDALDRGDLEALKEELGDILLHILLQAQIASERGEFRMSDIVCHVNTKIVHRHPHVFGGLEVHGVDEILVNWETIKQQEKRSGAKASSALDGIAQIMPALARAQSIQRHVKQTGIVDAVVGDLATAVVERAARLPEESDPEARERMLGDLLFTLANLARELDIDAESALRDANRRFERRFRAGEQQFEN